MFSVCFAFVLILFPFRFLPDFLLILNDGVLSLMGVILLVRGLVTVPVWTAKKKEEKEDVKARVLATVKKEFYDIMRNN